MPFGIGKSKEVSNKNDQSQVQETGIINANTSVNNKMRANQGGQNNNNNVPQLQSSPMHYNQEKLNNHQQEINKYDDFSHNNLNGLIEYMPSHDEVEQQKAIMDDIASRNQKNNKVQQNPQSQQDSQNQVNRNRNDGVKDEEDDLELNKGINLKDNKDDDEDDDLDISDIKTSFGSDNQNSVQPRKIQPNNSFASNIKPNNNSSSHNKNDSEIDLHQQALFNNIDEEDDDSVMQGINTPMGNQNSSQAKVTNQNQNYNNNNQAQMQSTRNKQLPSHQNPLAIQSFKQNNPAENNPLLKLDNNHPLKNSQNQSNVQQPRQNIKNQQNNNVQQQNIEEQPKVLLKPSGNTIKEIKTVNREIALLSSSFNNDSLIRDTRDLLIGHKNNLSGKTKEIDQCLNKLSAAVNSNNIVAIDTTLQFLEVSLNKYVKEGGMAS